MAKAEVVAKEERTSLSDAPHRGVIHLIEKAIRNHARELGYWVIVYPIRKKTRGREWGMKCEGNKDFLLQIILHIFVSTLR
jgi:hypothetical protein